MLGLLLIFFIWKQYYELAFEHNKSKWGYGLIGIATYYIGTFIGGVTIAILNIYANTHYFDESSGILLSLISMPFGLLFVMGLYKLLENRWESQKLLEIESVESDLTKSNNAN